MSLVAGTRLGRYEIRSKLVEGGMGKVYLASVRLTERRLVWRAVSPKNGMIAGLYRASESSPIQLAVFAPEGGAPVKTFELAAGEYSCVRWFADGSAILYLTNRAQSLSLWSQSLDGGAPKQLVDFSPEQIFSFAVSPDGRWFAFPRGTIIRDVVPITDSDKK